ncbi:MAG: YfiR family protein [Gammaproteobacteria bacterium]|nr:YfiR family protein [Gammaproteobacteria bacterium]
MIRSTKRAFVILLGMVLATTCANARADQPGEYEVKAAFIHNIAKFIAWPATTRTTGSLGLCVLGQNPFDRSLDTLQGQAIGDKVWEISSVNLQSNLHKCNVLFISASESGNLGEVLIKTKGDAVLTIGDTSGYAERGVIVNFYLERDKVRFEINNDAAERAGLKISSKLLKLARIVPDPGGSK